jgi:DNA-binding NarL/FixJ family response regulator
MKVLLVDDHNLVRNGLASLLVSHSITVAGEASDGLGALEKARQLKPDVILMDINMPHCNGLEATRLIKTEMPNTKIIILTVSEDEENLFEAIKSGAEGYLLKDIKSDEFPERYQI